MSPRSSSALRRHHQELKAKAEKEEEEKKAKEAESDDIDYFGALLGQLIPQPQRHRDSDNNRPSDRSLVPKRHPKDEESDSSTGEEVIEVLPDRFDSQGRPLSGAGTGSTPRMHSRTGDFEYRSPRGPRGTQMRGEWAVAGTDPEAVERIVRNVTGVLEGRGSWLGLLGGILGGGLLQGAGPGKEETKVRNTRRRRRSTGDHKRDRDRDDDDDDYFYGGERRRRGAMKAGRRREWDEG
jgi:hypothetical protein